MKILGLLAGAALLVGAQSASAATITNGSFETGNPTTVGFGSSGYSTEIAGSGAISGWTINGGSVDYIAGFWPAADGARSLDLSGNNPGTISQGVTGLVNGQEYKVTFSLRGNTDGPASSQSVDVSLGSYFGTFSAPSTSTSWVTQSFTFIYNGGSNLLVFAAGPNGPYGPGLDNVQIAATPIPGAILLFGSALGGMGFLGYRRRKAQAAA